MVLDIVVSGGILCRVCIDYMGVAVGVAVISKPYAYSLPLDKYTIIIYNDSVGLMKRRETKGETKMNRYQTKWYVTTDENRVAELCEIDHTKPEQVKVSVDVDLVHVQGSNWALWSDDKFTTAAGLRMSTIGMTPDAARLVSLCRDSDTGHVTGGLIRLTKIDKILAEEQISVLERSGIYAPDSITLFKILWLDGTTGELYARSQGYCEGYSFDIYDSKQDAVAMDADVELPATFGYDRELGWRKEQ